MPNPANKGFVLVKDIMSPFSWQGQKPIMTEFGMHYRLLERIVPRTSKFKNVMQIMTR